MVVQHTDLLIEPKMIQLSELISGGMDSAFLIEMVDSGSIPGRVKPKTSVGH